LADWAGALEKHGQKNEGNHGQKSQRRDEDLLMFAENMKGTCHGIILGEGQFKRERETESRP
jgi:hypothetical protein